MKQIIKKTLVIALIVFLCYGGVSYFFHSDLNQFGEWLGGHLGFWGIGLYCFFVDMLIIPTTIDVIFPFTMDWPAIPLLATMSLASLFGGFCGYLIARILNRFKIIHRMTATYHKKGKDLIERYGGWAVVIAGITPIPYSTVCWIAGLLGVPWYKVLSACSSRIPRIIIYYLLIRSGISLFDLVPANG